MKKLLLSVGILMVFLVSVFFLFSGRGQEKRTVVTIAVPKTDQVENFNTNYYTRWLEEQTGYEIRFEYIPSGYEKEYIHTMLTASESEIDGVFLSGKEDYLTVEELVSYGKKGLLTDLSDYVTRDSNFRRLAEESENGALCEKIKKDGAVYYFPNIDTARKSRNLQAMWINADWLKALHLPIPKTTEELRAVLAAFRDRDPNGNGKKDELPLISCEENASLQSYQYLLNAFAYNDPLHGCLYRGEDGELSCAAESEEFRRGLSYCRELYEEGLLTDCCFSYTAKQRKELVSSPEDLVGAFTCRSVADVIYPNFPDVLAKYIHVPPLCSEDGEKRAVWVDYELKIGGYVPANSRHAKEVCEIMDKMLSDEGALISAFGEKGVDWKDSKKSDLSIYGNKAYITTINYLDDRTQNKHFAGVGPQIIREKYVNGVTWNGDNSLVEYIDARAVSVYEDYYLPKERRWEDFDHEDEGYKELEAYIREKVVRFIVGEDDVSDDETWNAFTDELRRKREALPAVDGGR